MSDKQTKNLQQTHRSARSSIVTIIEKEAVHKQEPDIEMVNIN